MPDHDQVNALLREHYGEAARHAEQLVPAKECCDVVGARVYDRGALDELPEEAVAASIGCANPVAIADLSPGEDVLDLGSGGGIDVLLSARRVAPTGMAYGLDMTDDMLELARANQQRAGVTNAEFLSGHIEDVPLPDDSVDVVLSNCVINLSPRKDAVFAETFRVLRSGGRLVIADIVGDREPDAALLADPKAWTDCIAGALTRERYAELLQRTGFIDVVLTDSHAVQEGFWSVIVRARKP
ncbi:MAG: arsenite methyltransferase [Acidimicrobiia bacterium]